MKDNTGIGEDEIRAAANFLDSVSSGREKKQVREIIIYLLLSICIAIFAYFSVDALLIQSAELRFIKLQNNALQKKINNISTAKPFYNSGVDTIVSKDWLKEYLIIKGKGKRNFKFVTSDSNSNGITFISRSDKFGDGYKFTLEPKPGVNEVKEIVYSSSDSEFKQHIIKSSDAANNFYIEWYGKSAPLLMTIFIKYRNCVVDTHMFNMKSGEIIQ